MLIDGIMNGIVNFALFGLVVLIRSILHKEDIKSFLIHIDKKGVKLFAEGVIIGVGFFLIYPLTIVFLDIGSIDFSFGRLINILDITLINAFGFLGVALFEESLFRGYILIKLIKKYSVIGAITISSVIFGAVHLFPYLSSAYFWIGLINASIIGILLCITVVRSNSLMLAVGYHLAWNLTQTVMLKGNDSIVTLQSENNMLTGNHAIPESGLIVTGIVLAIGIYIYFRFKQTKFKLISEDSK